MSIGTFQDLKVYDPRVQGGFIETLIQNTDAFNAASRGTIRLVNNRKPGQFDYEAFFQNISGIVRRRDPSSTAAVADKKLTQGEFIGVKLNRGIGPVSMTFDSFRKAGLNPTADGIFYASGVMAAKAVVVDQLNTALYATSACLSTAASGALKVDASSAKMTSNDLIDGLAVFGDQADQILCWVMHSKVYFDLVKNQLAANITGVSNFNLATATPITLNRPVLVTDSPALITAGTPNTYTTLGLVAGATTLEDSEGEQVIVQPITGLDNLAVRMQGEYAFSISQRGTQWDVTNGGANPDQTAISTGTNWDSQVSDKRNLGGVAIVTQ